MQAVQETSYILSLRAKARAGGFDDLRVEAQALCDVDARRCSRHSDPQLVGWFESGLVEANGSIHHSGGVDTVHLERGVVRRYDRDAAGLAEVVGEGHSEGDAV